MREIKRLITGKVVTDEVHYTDHFQAGGAYEGVFMNKRLTGTWKVKGGPALHHPRIRG